jgi:outer membrane lipoprotein-sorting protein
VNIFRRLTLIRLLLVCALAAAIGVSATALAFALDSAPTPPGKPLAEAIHDALTAPAVAGVSANITFTDHLLEGANLASGGDSGEGAAGGSGLTSSPLVTGASGRLWVAKNGEVRLELQSEKGDTEILYDGHTLQLYDAATNTLYRYTPPPRDQGGPGASTGAWSSAHEIPSVTKIEAALAHAGAHANVSGATPTDVAGQPAYTVQVSPKEPGSLLGAAELSFDADNGVPLRSAIYAAGDSTPVLELAASEISYGPVAESVFAFSPPPGVKVDEIETPGANATGSAPQQHDPADKPKLTTYGHGVASVVVLEGKAKAGSKQGSSATLEGLPKVTIDGVSASELKTELGTVLSFERSGVRYLLAGAVTPAAIEAVARGL